MPYARCYAERVKKIMLIMLLIVLPFQMTWAAAAQCCMHDATDKTSHFGHHAHQHQADQQVVSKSVGEQANADHPASTFIDKDCPYCHMGSLSYMVTAVFIPGQILGVAPSDALLYAYSTIPPSQPERPKWSIAA